MTTLTRRNFLKSSATLAGGLVISFFLPAGRGRFANAQPQAKTPIPPNAFLRIGKDGTCTVHLDGEPIRSCVTPVSSIEGKRVVTIEGIDKTSQARVATAVQKAWVDKDVVQCGYCQSGQVMAAAALLRKNPNPSDADIDQAMSGNLCRCGTYQRIREAVHAAAASLKKA